MIMFRFANMFNLDSVAVDNIQSVAKTVKSGASVDLSCDIVYNTMLSFDDMLSQVKAVEQMLKIESSEQINDTLTKEELKTAAEMFLYLNTCPTAIKPWIVFYKDLFQTQSPDQIILSLNRVTKGPRTPANEFFKTLAGTLLKRISNWLPGREASIADTKAPQKFKGTMHHCTMAKALANALFLTFQFLHCLARIIKIKIKYLTFNFLCQLRLNKYSR